MKARSDVIHIACKNFIEWFFGYLELERVKHHALNYKSSIHCLLKIRLDHLDLKFFHHIIDKSLRNCFTSIEIVLILLAFQLQNFCFFLIVHCNYFSKFDWMNSVFSYLYCFSNYLALLFAFCILFQLFCQILKTLLSQTDNLDYFRFLLPHNNQLDRSLLLDSLSLHLIIFNLISSFFLI